MPNHSTTSTAAAQASASNAVPALDALTGGAFTAPTSGERAQRIRDWLASQPSADQMQAVFKELGARDKGAAKPLREKLDEIKRAKGQESLAAEWEGKALALLDASRFHIADALAWQRDAAKSGAPLSKPPLAGLKVQLAERIKGIEDLQHGALVQREAAVLMAQRIEVLSTKSWHDAQQTLPALSADVQQWQARAAALLADANWASVDAKFAPLLEASQSQLLAVWEAFSAAVALAGAAASDSAAPLPPVPVWANELRAQRGIAAEPVLKPGKPAVDPAVLNEMRAKANQSVGGLLAKLELEMAEGHGKASASAAASVRQALKEHGKHLDGALEARVHAALAAAGELEGWQRWRADQLRLELVRLAEALVKPQRQESVKAPAPDAAGIEGADAADQVIAASEPATKPAKPKTALGGRKLQETLRSLREQWKQTDQGGVPNHALWKRFDEACNLAYQSVEVWLEKVKSEEAAHRAQRLALIEEVKAWTVKNTQRTEPHEWKAFARAAQQFTDRWRDAGHIGEKAFGELQAQWKVAINAAYEPLESAQKLSLAERRAMIEQATALGSEPHLRIDAVKTLQQRWQAEAQTVPLERKLEQKLWESFRQPIDDAFNRKTQEREKADAALSERDRAVLEAAKALQVASASGDMQAIHSAMTALQAAQLGQAAPPVSTTYAPTPVQSTDAPAGLADSAAPASEMAETAEPASGAESATEAAESVTPEALPAPLPKPAKVVKAVRGDDRPGMKKAEPAPTGRGNKPMPGRAGAERPGDNRFTPRDTERGRFDRPTADRFADRGAPGLRRELRDAPRLGDAAFRAQRDALDHAQVALKKLAMQAHGEVLTGLLSAWQQRDAQQLPAAQALGSRVTAAARSQWAKVLSAAPVSDGGNSMLRLEMAAELPTPAAYLDARRALQLQLLTKRNDPPPAQTWAQDVAALLASAHDAESARRLQTALKVLLRREA